MLFNSLILLLLSNAITSRRDKSILYSRATITVLLISAFIAYDNLHYLFLAKGVEIFGGLFHVTATTIFFHLFIFLITSVILLLTSFYPRKVFLKEYSSPGRLLFTKLIYYGTLLLNKMREQFKIVEYLFFTKLFLVSIVIISLLFIPLSFDWSIPHFFILLLLTFSAVITLTLWHIQNDYYYTGDLLAVFSGNYIGLVDKTISDSIFNDTFICINIIIGLNMIIIGLLNNRKTLSIKDKFLLIIKNKEQFLIIALTMFLAIFILNVLLFSLGLGIIVDTSSLTLFLYTFFPKVISVRLILIFFICSITKEFILDNVSLSLSSLIFMMVLGSVNYYYVLPYFIMFLGLTNISNLLSRIYFADCWAIKANSSQNLADGWAFKTNSCQSLAEGIYNIITKFPIIGRFFHSFTSNYYNYYISSTFRSSCCEMFKNISSPFRSSCSDIIKNKMNIYPLTKISKFTRIDIARIVENKVELFYKGDISSLEVRLKNYNLYLRDLISSFVSSYSNLTCKINLTCADQIVTINTTFKNGHLEEFNLNRIHLNFVNEVDKKSAFNIKFLNSLLDTQCSKDLLDLSPKKTNSFDLCPKNIDSFYDPSADRTRELLHLTDPMKNGYDLQVFMQKGFPNYDYNIQQGESSRQSLHSSNLNRGIKRPLDSENLDIGGSRDISTNYPCLDIRMIKLQDKDYLFLDFDPYKLDSERDAYLEEICTIGRSVLMEHYSKLGEGKSAVRSIVDRVEFEDISISENIHGGYIKLYKAFYQKNLDIIKSHEVEPENIHPFSKLYLEGNLDYPESDYSEDDSSDDGDNLDNSNLDDGDNSNNYVSLGDSKQKGKEVLKWFTSEQINDLINRLRSKQLVFFSKRHTDSSIKCNLQDIGLTFFKGTFLFKNGENAEDEITNMFNVLIKVKPDLFSKVTNDIIKVSINTLCSRLKELTQSSVNELTEENLTILSKELKSRIHNFFRVRGFDIGIVTCEFRETQIKNIKGIIVEGSNLVENDFTKLLTILIEKKPEFFTKKATKVNLSKTGLIPLYNRISNLIQKPITKDQVAFLINGLESRKNNLLEHRRSTGNTSELCVLTDLFFTRNSILLDKDAVLVEYELTGLLENLRREKHHLFVKRCNIDLLIIQLRLLYHELI